MRLIKLRVPDVFDGRSMEDLPSEVLLMFLESSNRLGWNPEKGSLDKFLFGVLKHKMIDHARRQLRTSTGSLDDPDFQSRKQVSDKCSVSSTNQETELRHDLAQVVTADPELGELMRAAQDIDDGPNINQKLAQKLMTTPQDIVNRKKRLARKYDEEL